MWILYEGSNHTMLAACIMIMNLKATRQGMTDYLVDDMLATFRRLLLEDNCLPVTLY